MRLAERLRCVFPFCPAAFWLLDFALLSHALSVISSCSYSFPCLPDYCHPTGHGLLISLALSRIQARSRGRPFLPVLPRPFLATGLSLTLTCVFPLQRTTSSRHLWPCPPIRFTQEIRSFCPRSWFLLPLLFFGLQRWSSWLLQDRWTVGLVIATHHHPSERRDLFFAMKLSSSQRHCGCCHYYKAATAFRFVLSRSKLGSFFSRPASLCPVESLADSFSFAALERETPVYTSSHHHHQCQHLWVNPQTRFGWPVLLRDVHGGRGLSPASGPFVFFLWGSVQLTVQPLLVVPDWSLFHQQYGMIAPDCVCRKLFVVCFLVITPWQKDSNSKQNPRV